MRKSIALILAVLLIGTTVAGAVLYELDVREAGNLRSKWPTTQGTILSSTILRDFENSETAFIIIRFAYEAKGTRYSAQQAWREWLTRTHQYSEGSSVTVYYNPAKPSEAVIEPREQSPGSSLIGFGLFAMALVAIIAGIWILIGEGQTLVRKKLKRMMRKEK
ncbi:MAG: hypothetical protein A2144_04905 [Chloroflexi bacterium RBG_16_50_9]|nr:MAG: hypothetical protein A2144_04905 [Chloroflexi bacterium RBG_16_50_9]